MAAASQGGLIESLRHLAATLLDIIQTRLQLLSNEIEEEALRASQMLLLVLGAIVCFAMAALMFSALVVVLLWDTHPLAALTALGVLYFVLGMGAVVAMRAKLRERSGLFSASLAEVAKDRVHVENRERAPG
jgi:uncharacterized membrane protein YqjE